EDRPPGEERQLRRPRTEEVEEASEGREVAAGEWSTAAAEAEDLEEHAPDDGLLERHRVKPPRRDGGRPPQRWAVAAEEHPAADVEGDLERIRDEDRVRRAVSVHRPRLAHHPPALEEGLLHPLERIVGGRCRREEPHLAPRISNKAAAPPIWVTPAKAGRGK